jgi:hypothetical protein
MCSSSYIQHVPFPKSEIIFDRVLLKPNFLVSNDQDVKQLDMQVKG